MTLLKFKNYGFLAAAMALVCAGAQAQAAEALTRGDVEKIVREVLIANPEIIMESVEAYRNKQEEQARAAAEKNIEKSIGYLAANDAPSAGNPKADVTVVEFFDYNCGYCKRALPDIQALLASDKNLRIVFRDMPILSESSMMASQWAVAAHNQGKYFDYHVALMNHNGEKNKETLKKLAKDAGLDVEKLEKDAASPEVAKVLEKNVIMASDIGIHGTPAFIINGEFHPGYLGPDGLKEAVEAARKGADGQKKE